MLPKEVHAADWLGEVCILHISAIHAARVRHDLDAVCMQVVDDILDLTASSNMLGKPALNDLKSGIATAPVRAVRC